jgi:sporulation protein YlmC with PRC-barrel domain
MKIRFRLPVHAADGPFGEIADVVIDPITRTITHLVVEPHHRHYQARLVPIDLVDLSEERVDIRLDTERVRALSSVADSDFVALGERIDLGDEWDVGLQHIVAMPYSGGAMAMGAFGDSYSMAGGTTVDFDRVPKGECEIRRESHVISSDDHEVGLVDGFLADESHIEGVIVVTGLPGFRHLVVVPIGSVTRVSNDRIEIALDRETFRRLRPVSELVGVHAPTTRLERLEHTMATTGKGLRERIEKALHRTPDPGDGSSSKEVS